MPEKRDLEDHEHVDDGLRLAFGSGGGSVLDAIESISGTRARILLRDAPDDASPMLRVPGPREEGSATDDSRYQIVGEIARGGVGVVYKGRDKDLGRDVALKVLRTELAQDDPVIQRFIEEAQVGAQLQHPGIVPIYGIGLQADGKPYFAMKLVKGETLTALIEQGEKTSALIGVFERIAQTVAYAHSRGVIHRDLKPSNVMVGAFGEAQVVDWGFAKVLGREDTAPRPGVTMVATVRTGAEGSQSIMGSVMGTPAYMPPEQAMGQVDELTERSDVFSLGAILCEILTRKPPYTGTMQDQLLAAAQTRLDEAYARLSECNAPEPIKQLARDCMAPLPKDRPANAGVVAQRLADHLASVEERARQAELDAVHAAAEMRKAQRSRRTTITLAAVALIALLGGGLGYAAWSGAERTRTGRIAARVAPLLREATRLEGEERWSDARAAAAAAVALAESGGADSDPLESARNLHDRIEAKADAADALAAGLARENALLFALDELYMQSVDLSAAQKESRYLSAFRDFGVNVEQEDAAAALADFSRPVALAIHLDQWARWRRKVPGADWAVLDRLARAIDDDDWRNRLRDHVASKDIDALRQLASSEELREQAPATLASLAIHLKASGDPEAAVRLLRRGRVWHPEQFSIQYGLARTLTFSLSRPADAMPHAIAALALRPDSAGTWNQLGAARYHLGDNDGAIRAFGRALQIDPRANGTNLGVALMDEGDLNGAIAAHRKALRFDPDNARIHSNLGITLARRGDYDAAVAAHHEAIRLDPARSDSHNNLGVALNGKGDWEASIAACREAIRINRESADAHSTLAIALEGKGDLDGAVAAFREAIRLEPDHGEAHGNLGRALSIKGDFDSAIVAYREAIRRNPGKAGVHTGLGIALAKQNDLDGALVAFRESVRLDPADAGSQHNLGMALGMMGDLDGALAAYREARWIDPTRQDIAKRHSATLAKLLDGRVQAVLSGKERVENAVECLGVAELLAYLERHPQALPFFRQAFAADPKLVRLGGYMAARSAVAVNTAESRAWALGWMRGQLDSLRPVVDRNRGRVAGTLRHWKRDDLLTDVDPAANDELPEAERRGWEAFWADVEAMLEEVTT